MFLKREFRGRVEVLTIERPEVRNAINAGLAEELWDAFEQIEASPEVTAAILTGSGEQSFSAGADLKAMAYGDDSGTGRGLTVVQVCERGLAKPLIAAVNGSCLAGGLELALTCDLIVAAEHATFGLPEPKRGLVAGAGGVTRLAPRIGLAAALELVLTGDAVDAQRALELGLINRVVPASEVMASAVELASRIGENAPVAVKIGKRLVRESLGRPEEEVWRLNHAALREILATEDAKEGPLAFSQKRKPRWQGR